MIALVENYLPDGIIQDLIDARDELQTAKDLANDPSTTPEELEAALTKAKDKLDAANAAYKAALLEFFNDFLNIIVTSITELNDSLDAVQTQIDIDFNASKTTLDNWLTEQNNQNSSDSTSYSNTCLLYTSPSPRDRQKSRMPSSA